MYTPETSCVKRTSVYIKNTRIKHFCNHKLRDFALVFRAAKTFGTFDKPGSWALGKRSFYDCEGLGLQWSRSNKGPPFLFWNKSSTEVLREFLCDKMAHTVISVKLPPNIDPTKSRIAYGDRALPKLVSTDLFWNKLECRFRVSDTRSDVII